MARVLIHLAYPLWRKNALVGYARALESQQAGDDVTVSYCAAKNGVCAVNQAGNPAVCLACRSSVQKTIESIGLRALPLAGTHQVAASRDSKLTSKVKSLSCNSDQRDKIPLSERKELLEGVLSGLISTFRLLPKDIKRHALMRHLKRRYYRTALALLSDMRREIKRCRPDRFEVFNGRHACSKFGLIVARSEGIPFNTMEVTAKKRPILFCGHVAHDRVGVQQRIRNLPVDWDLAESFFSARRRPDQNKFVKHQASGTRLIPMNKCSRLVSIFLSSQDEFESLGSAWKSSFPPDHKLISATCRQFPETMFCIRFHPNQAGIKSDIQSPFGPIAAFPNATVFRPLDQCNTYGLIDQSDIVVTFNSTVGVEACWAGKPTIMLGPSFYDQLQVAYTPPDIESFWELLREPRIEAKDRTGAAKLAYYASSDGDDFEFLETIGGDLNGVGFRRRQSVAATLARHTSVISQSIARLLVRAA